MCPLGQVRGRYLNMSHRAPKCLATVLITLPIPQLVQHQSHNLSMALSNTIENKNFVMVTLVYLQRVNENFGRA
jgi:hypothetical protein